VGLDLGIPRQIPWAVEVVCEYSQPIDLSFERLCIHVLHILVLGRDNNTETKVATKSLSHLFEELGLVGSILRFTPAAFVPWPLPVDVNTAEVPLRKEPLQRIDECLAVFLAACHVGPCVSRRPWIGELEAADADPLGNAVG
jgi:hypothetical protein